MDRPSPLPPQAATGVQPVRRFRVFVSYSRGDLETTERIRLALESDTLECLVDTRDLPYGEQWKPELEILIRRADAVCFVLSPRSIASTWCLWEVAQITRYSKRIVPVAIAPVAATEVPPQIAAVQVLPLHQMPSFDGAMALLREALTRDRAWLLDHTRLAEVAHRWSDKRPGDLLLRGAELREALAWRMRRPQDAPSPSRQQLDFILASETAAAWRVRMLAGGAVAVATVTVVLAGWAYVERGLAQTAAQVAQAAEGRASAAAADARQRLAALYAERGREALQRNDNDVATAFLAAARQAGHAGDDLRLMLGHLQRATQGRVATFKGHSAPVARAHFSADGRRLVTVGRDRIAIVWDAASGRPLAQLAPQAGALGSAQLSADGRYVVTVSRHVVEDADIAVQKLWSADTGALVKDLSSEFGQYVWSPAGSRFVKIEQDEASVWQAEGAVRLFGVPAHGRAISAAALARGGQLLTASADRIRLADPAGAELSTTSPRGEPLAAYFAGHGEGTARYVSAEAGQLVLFDARSGAQVATLAPWPGGRPQLIVSADATRLALRTLTGIQFWDAASGAAAGRIEAAMTSGEVDFDSAMRQMVHRSGDQVQVWSAAEGAWRATPIECVRCQLALIDPQGEKTALFHADFSGSSWAWRQRPPPVQQKLGALPAPSTGRCSVAAEEVSDEGAMMRAVVRCAGSAAPVEARYYGLSSFTAPVLTADGAVLATPHGDSERGAYNVPHVWAVGTTKPTLVTRIVGHSERVTAIAFDAAGRRLLTADGAGSMHVWDARSGALLGTLAGHKGAITGAAFHRGGELIASVGADRHLRLWNARSGRQILALELQTALTGVVFEGDEPGRLLGTAVAGFQNEAFRIVLPLDDRGAEELSRWALEASPYRVVEGAAVRN